MSFGDLFNVILFCKWWGFDLLFDLYGVIFYKDVCFEEEFVVYCGLTRRVKRRGRGRCSYVFGCWNLVF